MEHVNGWCFRGIYKGGLWENDLHVSAHFMSVCNGSVLRFIAVATVYFGHITSLTTVFLGRLSRLIG